MGDGCVALLDAQAGVEPQTETVWRQANDYRVPRIIFANKMDKTGADFAYSVKTVGDRLGANAAAIQWPIGAETAFNGVIDLVEMKAWHYDGEAMEIAEEIEIPADLLDICEERREMLVEKLADLDEDIMMMYLEGEEVDAETLKAAIRQATLEVKFFPVMCGSAYKNIGVKLLLDAVLDYLPAPTDVAAVKGTNGKDEEIEIPASDEGEFAALAFKVATDPFVGKLTFFRVYSGTLSKGSYVRNATKGKKERIGRILQMHANSREEIDRVYAGDIAAAVGAPQVSYRETFTKEAEVEGKFVRQSGGRGQYGHVWIKFESNPQKGYEFVDKIVGGKVPREYIPVVDKGLQESLDSGVLAGYPLIDVKATLFDGSYHDVDSSEMAFKVAASLALKKAKDACAAILLEPLMSVDVIIPDEYLGNVIGDITSRRGRMEGQEQRGNAQMIKAKVPLSEMFGYATSLRSNTQGRGNYTMQFSHYEPCPKSIAEEVIEKRNG